MDLDQNRVRVQYYRSGQVTSFTVVADESAATYDRDQNRFREYDFPSQPLEGPLPPYLNNSALAGLGILYTVLGIGDWRSFQVGKWEGEPATVWDVEIGNLGSELPGPFDARVYLDPEDTVPLGLEIVFPEGMADGSSDRLLRGCQVDFIGDDAESENLFDASELQAMVGIYGGKLDEAKSLDFEAVWLGTEVELRPGYPTLELKNISLGARDLIGSYAHFSYESNREGVVDKVDIRVWEREAWESGVSQNAPADVWWRDPDLVVESIDLGAIDGQYAIGYPGGPAAARPVLPTPTAPVRSVEPDETGRPVPKTRTRPEIRLWLPNSVVSITARSELQPIEIPASQDDLPSKAPLATATPGFPPVIDPSVFSTEDGLRELARALRVLE